jgi:hypothetical protein
LQQVGEPARALKHCRAAIQAAPRDPGAHLLAHELAVRTGAHDSAWNAAHALDFLGEADINASLHADTHRPEGLLPVTATLTDEHWQSGSFTPGRDVQLEAILALLRAPAIEHRLDSLARARELPQPDPTLRVDPAASTTTLARSFLWTVQLLAVPQPALYVDPALETGLVALPTREPSSVVNRSLGSGLDLRELSFLWGRHLASFRPEARLLTFYPTAELLAQLLAAAAAVARDGNDESELAPDVDALARRIRNDLTEAERGALVDALRDFPFAEADRRLLEWARGVELTAARAGLVACGDVSVAAPLTERFPVVGHTTAFDQVSALLAFTASDEYAAIREHLGVVVRG